MNSFEAASAVEARGMTILLPYLDAAADGRLVITNKGMLSRYLQLIAGDVLINDRNLVLWSIEVKVEAKTTGNLFLETWSNRNLEDKANHASHGSNPGWLIHSRADLLLYYFLDTDDLYIIKLFKLKRWAFGHGEQSGEIYRFPEVSQSKYHQKNDTHGRLVSLSALKELKIVRHCKVKQLALFESESMTEMLK